ncbi:MAG: aminotransferase class I/II-fold pyridoxal phosphate-dependent enzyme [Patescibacteria group bacterium]
MRKSLLSVAPGNIFQAVKAQRAEAEKAGIKIINLTIGQPSGPAIEEARIAAAHAVMSAEESMHEYQDNGSPGVSNFARRFVQQHLETRLNSINNVGRLDFLPLPGIKPMLDVVVKSLGTWERDVLGRHREARVFTMTKPGYPTPAYACKAIVGINHFDAPMSQQNGFLFSPQDLESEALSELEEGDMVMLNFPENPTGIIATEEWLLQLCGYCERRGVRIFNDGAYHILNHSTQSVTLTDIALKFPGLNWVEAFSASKAGNFTGWRVAAMVGSSEFMGDIKRVKGDSDSGFVAFAAAGIIHLFENHKDKIMAVRDLYEKRLYLVARILINQGMRLAVKPEAGFFLLFDSPQRAFGQSIKDAAEFNSLMIQHTGIAGVPFGKWIRYAICATDVEAQKNEIGSGFEKAKVEYDSPPAI